MILLILQQSLLSAATLSLAFSASAFSTQDTQHVIIYLMLFFGFALCGYLFHGLLEHRLSQRIALVWHNQVKTIFHDFLKSPCTYSHAQKHRFLTGLSSEAMQTIEHSTRWRHQYHAAIISLCFNLALCIGLLGQLLSLTLLGISLVCILSCLRFNTRLKKLSELSARLQQRQFSHLRQLWDCGLHGTETLFTRACNTAAHLYHRRKKLLAQQTKVEQCLAATPITLCTLLIMISLCFFAPKDVVTLSYWLAVLPRLLPMFAQLHSLSLSLSQRPHLKHRETRLKNFLTIYIPNFSPDMINKSTHDTSKIEFTHHFAKQQHKIIPNPIEWIHTNKTGRLCLRGPNGSGKSSWLQSIKHQLNEAILLTPHTQLTTTQLGLSLGQQQQAQLLFALKKNAAALLLDEWDAHLDAETKLKLDAYLSEFSKNNLVIEVRHG